MIRHSSIYPQRSHIMSNPITTWIASKIDPLTSDRLSIREMANVEPTLTDPASPDDRYHHQSYAGGPVKCRRCGYFVARWVTHERRYHLPFIDVVVADMLREIALQVENERRHGRDEVAPIMWAMDMTHHIGQDDVSDGLATLAVDVMLANVTGISITGSLERMADEIAPPA